MARFLKQSFAQICLKETDNGKLWQFNYSRSLITNWGTVERGKIHSARANYYGHCHGQMGVSLLGNKAELQLVQIAILIGQFQSDRAF